jgi:DNA-binding NtrC family response regulator
MLERVLILEDTPSQLRGAGLAALHMSQFRCVPVDTVENPLHLLDSGKLMPAVIIADLTAYSAAQVNYLLGVRACYPRIPMVALLPFGSEGLRQKLLMAGAHDTLTKPVALDRLSHCLALVLKMQRMSALIARMEQHRDGQVALSDVVGHSAAMTAVLRAAEHAMGERVPCLIEGEQGTGKTLLPRVWCMGAARLW